MGEWNKMKIKVVGSTVTTWLNDTEMITITDDKIGEGEGGIALQIHDGGGIGTGNNKHGVAGCWEICLFETLLCVMYTANVMYTI